MIGVCTDSNAQLPSDLVTQHGIEVVPLTVRVDGVDHLEGVDLDADGFYDLFEGGHQPDVATAGPSPGRLAAAYQRLAASGASEIVSVHIGAALSSTLNAAKVAAASSPVPVHLVDTGSASFVVGCAALAASETIAVGGSGVAAAEAAHHVARICGNVFVVGTLDLARSGGRLAPASETAHAGVPVLRLEGAAMETVGTVTSPVSAAELMAAEIVSAGTPVRVGVGTSDPSSRAVGHELCRLLGEADADIEVIPYRVGPSVGAHTGPGTAGAVYHPRDVSPAP